MLWSVSKFSQLDIHHIFLVYAASSVTFEDSEKQKIYETISFDSLRAEVEELRVKRCSLCCYCFLSWLPFRQVQHRRCKKDDLGVIHFFCALCIKGGSASDND
jgi:hypothetical protein